MFDLATQTWSILFPQTTTNCSSNIPCARYFSSSTVWGDLLLVHGGVSSMADFAVLDDLWAFNTTSRTWTLLARKATGVGRFVDITNLVFICIYTKFKS